MADDEKSVVGEQRWYTIPEAADYLGVSEPTIYRWMKKGILSFYKVGGSTRFTQEGLDVVVEKTTGRKEAEAAHGRCTACGHTVLVEGRIQTAGRVYFKPEHTRFWTFQESMVPVVARVCTACGFIQLHADADKLNRLLPEDEPEEGG
jgi:excisionase family DNA binding protein